VFLAGGRQGLLTELANKGSRGLVRIFFFLEALCVDLVEQLYFVFLYGVLVPVLVCVLIFVPYLSV